MHRLTESPFGATRTTIAADYALFAPDGNVVSPLSSWTSTDGIILISPALAAAPRSPRFTQYLALTTGKSHSTGAPAGVQRFCYVLAGEIAVDGAKLTTGGFCWLPPDVPHDIKGLGEGRVMVFEKPYAALPNTPPPAKIVSSRAATPTTAFLGDEAVQCALLLPAKPEFDMAMNIVHYQPGATLPFVETHVMEHGLVMLEGQGIYRLANDWFPVQTDDVIWMAAYCPQWFVAMGKEPASYLLYKDVHRHPLSP